MSAAFMESSLATADIIFTGHGQPSEPGETMQGRGGQNQKPSTEILLASDQLCSLASLHHESEYSRLKYGPNGSPSTYIPMSIHVPDYVERVKELQAICVTQRAWWLSSKKLVSETDQTHQAPMAEPLMTRAAFSVDLTEDLQAALMSTLDTQARIPPTKEKHIQPQMRTSNTHPINISTMIPPELLQIIASNLHRSDQNLPVIFDVPLSCQLHRLLFRSHHPRAHARSDTVTGALPLSDPQQTATLSPSSPHLLTPTSRSSTFVNLLWTQTFLRNAVVTSTYGNRGAKGFSAFRHAVISDPASNVDGKDAVRTLDVSPTALNFSDDVAMCLASDYPLQANRRPPDSKVLKRNSVSPAVPLHEIPMRASGCNLGNLFLSSCPGKKVRLGGPVKGRGAVCRDLKQDLSRMSDMGVRCVVCCLDDSELQLLGAPWQEYSCTADELGLDVLRVQIPEGLVPLDVEAFDAHLTRLIDTYTLTGRHVLVHCRGGVGRAGLIASCWMMKLGLCGWIETEPRMGRGAYTARVPLPPVKSDTLRVVQRVLAVVRKQRSPKAIETFEQVKFLVDFVEYLRDSAKTAVYSRKVMG